MKRIVVSLLLIIVVVFIYEVTIGHQSGGLRQIEEIGVQHARSIAQFMP